ncbi:MAG: hypothetical protein ABFR97_05890 [Thermodesulfobacteriota bacterium]
MPIANLPGGPGGPGGARRLCHGEMEKLRDESRDYRNFPEKHCNFLKRRIYVRPKLLSRIRPFLRLAWEGDS